MASSFQTTGDGSCTGSQNGSSTDRHQKRPEIATFVFVDLEATSLLDGRQKPRIVELCLLAVHRADLLQASQQGSAPRITNKLTLCFDPAKPMSYGASEITGLYNDSLENQSRLCNKTAVLIRAFIDHLAKPVCLIAHNGNGFDFPLLKAEFKRIKEELSNDILCADSLEAFRSLDGLPARHEMSANKNHHNNFQGSTPKSTQIVWNKPPVKRKLGENDTLETNTKQVKVNTEQFDVNIPITKKTKLNADKVKKKLFSDEENLNKNASDNGSQNEAAKGEIQQKDLVELYEFSASIEDDVLISVLDDVENQSNETISDTESTPEPSDSELSQADSIKAEKAKFAVETSTGYYVCKPLEKDKNTNDFNKVKQDPKISLIHEKDSITTPLKTSHVNFSTSPQAQSSCSSPIKQGDSLSLSASGQSASSTSQQSSSVALATLSPCETPVSPQSPSSPSLFQTSAVTHTKLMSTACQNGSNLSGSATTVAKSLVTPCRSGTSPFMSIHTQQSPLQQSPRLSYKLEQVYIRKFGCRPDVSHSAEDDCVTLLKISCRTPKLLEWLDENAVRLSSIEAAY